MTARDFSIKLTPALLACIPAVLLLALFDVPAALLVTLAVGGIALLYRFAHHEPFGVTVATTLAGALVIIGVLVPSVVGIFHLVSAAYESVLTPDVRKTVGIFLVVLLLLAGWLTLAIRWKYSETAFIIAALVFFGLFKLAYVMHVEMPPVSDFSSMLYIADSWARNGVDGISGSAGTQARSERVLLYLYPIRALLGTDGNNYQYVNVAASCITAMLSWFVARQFFGPVAARVALVAALLAIEPLQAAEIPTHDIPGALSIMSFIALFVLLWRDQQHWCAWLWAALLGVVMLWGDLQRSVSVVLQLSLLAYALLSFIVLVSSRSGQKSGWLAGGRQLLLAFVVPLLAFSLLSAAFSTAGLKRETGDVAERRMTLLVAHSESWGNGSYRYRKNNWDFESFAPRPFDFALRRLVSDTYYSPGARVEHYIRKSGRLYDFGFQQAFYMPKAGRVNGEPVESRHRNRALVANRAFAIAFLLFLGAGAGLSLITWRKSLERQFPLMLLAILCGLLILFAEVQPRYAFPIYYIGSIYVGYLLAALFGRERTPSGEHMEDQP